MRDYAVQRDWCDLRRSAQRHAHPCHADSSGVTTRNLTAEGLRRYFLTSELHTLGGITVTHASSRASSASFLGDLPRPSRALSENSLAYSALSD